MKQKFSTKSLFRRKNFSQNPRNFSAFPLFILLSLGTVCIQQQVNASTPVENPSRISNNATDLIESSSIKPQSPITKKSLNQLYIQPDELIFLVIKLSDRRVYVYREACEWSCC